MELSKTDLGRLKKILREYECPYFSDDELLFYYLENNGDMNLTLYNCFLVKAEDTTLNVSGLNCADTSSYFRRLAQKYRPHNSGVLK